LHLHKDDLFIDLGNSAIKWRFKDEYFSSALKYFNSNTLPKARKIWVSSVGDKTPLSTLTNVTFVTSKAKFGSFISAYKEPETLGVDRWLAMVAGVHKYPDQNLLVIDAGSALTFDVVLADGKHQGGLIMPGLGVLRAGFNQFTTNSVELKAENLADNTKEAWSFGTSKMFINAINGQINTYQSMYKDLVVILTGGDAKNIEPLIEGKTHVHQNLVLDGLIVYSGII